MAHYGDDRAPLEATKFPVGSDMVVCPNCKTGFYVNIKTWVSTACPCGKYFNRETSLPADKAETLPSIRPVNKAFTELKGNMEKQAYEWRDEQIKKKKAGKIKTHEPEDVIR